MTRYIAFLRAINVGGHGIVKMEELRRMFALPGISNITTYIQSGNLVFDAKEADANKLRLKIEKMLLKELDYEVTTFLRTVEEMGSTVNNNPFTETRLADKQMVYVSFLNTEPGIKVKQEYEALSNEYEQFKIIGRDVYTIVDKTPGLKFKSNMTLLEKKLKQPATARNWNTVNKMLDLSLKG